MTSEIQERLLATGHEIQMRAQQLTSRYFEQSELVRIDYLSIFTNGQADYGELSEAASQLGSWVANKRGDVYRIEDKSATTLQTSIVRISNPTESSLIGCVDLIPVNFETSKAKLLAVGSEEQQKNFNGRNYTIVSVVDPELGVAIYLPSEPLTDIMGIK